MRISVQPDLTMLRMWYDALNTGKRWYIRSKALMWSTRIKMYRARAKDKAAWQRVFPVGTMYPLDILTLETSKHNEGYCITLSRRPQIDGELDANGKLIPTPEPRQMDIEELWETSQDVIRAAVLYEMQRTGYAALTLASTPAAKEVEPEDDLPEEPEVKPAPKPTLTFTQPSIEPPPPLTPIEREHLYAHPEFTKQLRHYQQVSHTLTEEQILYVALRRTAKKVVSNGVPAEEQTELPLELRLELTAAANKSHKAT